MTEPDRIKQAADLDRKVADFPATAGISKDTIAMMAFAKRAHALSRELRRFDLSIRPLILAHVILDHTIGCGHDWVRVPRLEVFSALTGFSTGNISEALQMLHTCRIIRIKIVQNTPQYQLREDSHQWQCTPRRTTPAKILEAEQWLAEFNGHDCSACPITAAGCPAAQPGQAASAAGGNPENFRASPETQFLPGLVPDSGIAPDPDDVLVFPHLI